MTTPSETQEIDFEAETQAADVGESNIARLWFQNNACFNPPLYEAPSTSHLSSEVQDARIGSLNCKLPTLAFLDKDKAKRFAKALDDALGDAKLKAGSTSPEITDDKEIEALYKKLFSPNCEEDDGLKSIAWRRIANEFDSNALTRDALMNAVVKVTKRMLDKDITVRTEPMNSYQDETTTQKPELGKKKKTFSDYKERVDMVVTDETDTKAKGTKDILKQLILFLIEGTNPNVIEALAKKFRKGKVIDLDLYSNSTNQKKILNKIIYYMLFWDIPLLVVSSFTTAFILELHRTDNDCFISYSSRLNADSGTLLFRAILGLTWVALKKAKYEEFPVDAAFVAYKQKKANENKNARLTRSGSHGDGGGAGRGDDDDSDGRGDNAGAGAGAGRGGGDGSGRGGGAGSGSGSSSSKKGGSGGKGKATKKTSGEDASDGSKKTSASKNGIKRPLDISGVDSMVSGRPASKEPAGMIIRLEDSKEFTIGTGLHLVEFVRDARSPFPILPTSDRVPCLTLVQAITSGSACTVYSSELQAPWDSKVSNFIVKVIDFKQRSHHEYRNAFDELLQEYETYYRLGQCKRDNKFSAIIESTTPACYGLYKARRKRRDVFVLVLEDAGDVTLEYFSTWPRNERIGTMTSLICLHSLGLFHGDVAERNVAVKRNGTGHTEAIKFIDFDNTSWHECPGIEGCEELEDLWDDLFSHGDAPFNPPAFEELVARRHQLHFCNMGRRPAKLPEMECEIIVTRLKKLGKVYNDEYDEVE